MALPRSTSGGLPSHLRSSSGLTAHLGSGSGNSSQVTALQARIHEKKAELDSIRQLRDLAVHLAEQMEQLERKLATLSDGTEAVATVLANWHSVLRAVYMASSKIPAPKPTGDEANINTESRLELPQTLVRIPIQQAEAAQRAQILAAREPQNND